jgi:potassium efflux system protein
MTARARACGSAIAAGLILCTLALVAGFFSAAPAMAQGEAQESLLDRTTASIERWTRTLDEIDSAGAFLALDAEAVERNRATVRAVLDEAQDAVAELTAAIQPLQAQLQALSPRRDAPAGAPADASGEDVDGGGRPAGPAGRPVPELNGMRADLSARIAELEAARRQADALVKRAEALIESLIASQRASLVERLTHAGPLPWSPEAVTAAVAHMPRAARQIAASPRDWWRGLTPEQRSDRARQIRAAAIVIFGVLAVMLARRWLLRRFGRDPAVAEPGYARRLGAAVIEGGGRGVFPALALLGLVAFISREGALLSGLFADVVIGALSAAALYLAAQSILAALVSPDSPPWALLHVPGGRVGVFLARGRMLAAVLSIDVGVGVAARSMVVAEQAAAAFAFAMTVAEAAALWRIADSRLWGLDEGDDDTVDDLDAVPEADGPSPDADADEAGDGSSVETAVWLYLRRIAQAAAVVSVVAQLAGYTELGRFLMVNVLLSFGVVALILLARGVLRETVGVLARSRLARRRLGLSARFTRRMKFWIRAALDPVLFVVALFVVLPLWGVPRDTLTSAVGVVTGDVPLGSVSVSPAAIVTAIVAFFVIMTLVRILRGRFLTPVLSELRMDAGAREAVSTGVGYVGAVVALLLAVTVAGFDLTNLAIVAGALSVGIGFGLQNTVNNFLSGLILLVERPIKIGDWVVVGQVEGFVKEINFRTTEIETWRLASIMVPNGDVISSAVTNWTHHNKRARVEVRLGVSFDTDPEQVRTIMLECARAHPKALKNPPPHVLFLSHAEDRAILELRVFTGDAIWMMWIASELRFEISKRLKEAGIDLPLPRRIIYSGSEHETAPPPPAD